MRFRAALAPVVIAASAILAGPLLASCGGGSDGGTTGTTVPADVTVIAVEGIAWDAKDYTATAGEITIAAVNESSLPHNLHIVDPSGTQVHFLAFVLHDDIRVGDEIAGPAIVEEATTTLVLPPGTRARLMPSGSYVVSIDY